MKYEETWVQTAGVMRCCVYTVGEEFRDKRVALGDKSQCRHCKQPFTLVDKEGRPTWMPDWQLKEEK